MILASISKKRGIDSGKNVEYLIKIIDKSVNYKDNKNFVKDISKIINLPDKIIEQKVKQILFKEFNFKTFQFKSNKSKFLNILFNLKVCVKFFVFILLLIFFSSNSKKEKIKKSILIENVESTRTLNIYKNLIKKNSNICLLLNKIFFLNNHYVSNIHELFIPYKSNIFSIGELFKLIKKYFFLSVKTNKNFLSIFFSLSYSYAKNLSKYSYIRSKYLIHNRIYLSCPIRNYIFKKSGGNKVITIQSHIIESTISSYSDLDHLLSFGKSSETKSKLLRLGGKINKIKPIGSLRMEYELNQKRKIEKNKKIDILILGVNPTKWIDTSNKIKDGYYIFLKWMVEISKLNPDLNIEYKHHETFKGDKIEERIFMNSKIKKSIYGDKNLSSYDYLLNSSIAFSYCSTMVLEAQALKKIAFFVDPNDVATTFFSHLPSLKKLRINNFKELKKIIKRNIYKKDFDSVFEASDVICLGSKNVTKNLLNYLKN